LLFLLGEKGLKGDGQLAEAGGFGPGELLVKRLGKKAAAATCALGEAGQQLVAEGLGEALHLIGFHLVAGVHGSLLAGV
jgi:hypothetical protein